MRHLRRGFGSVLAGAAIAVLAMIAVGAEHLVLAGCVLPVPDLLVDPEVVPVETLRFGVPAAFDMIDLQHRDVLLAAARTARPETMDR